MPVARSQPGPPLGEAWAKTDPHAASLRANENLTEVARSTAAAAEIVRSMAEEDRAGAAEFLATLPPGPDGISALKRCSEAWIGDAWFNGGDEAEASAALTCMSFLTDIDESGRTMEQAAFRLIYRAPDETVAFPNSPQGASAAPLLFDQGTRHPAQKNPETALPWTATLPPEHRASAQRAFISKLAGAME